MQAVLKAQISKTDRNNARGIQQMMRVVKTLRCQTADPLLASAVEAMAIHNDLVGVAGGLNSSKTSAATYLLFERQDIFSKVRNLRAT